MWDGDQILYEIRYPGNDTSSTLEQDSGFIGHEEYHLEDNLPRNTTYSQFVGRVLYLHGPGIDQPFTVVRADYGRKTAKFDPFGIDLVTNWRGSISAGVYSGGLESTKCKVASFYTSNHGTERSTENVCVEMDWSEPNTAYRRAAVLEPRS